MTIFPQIASKIIKEPSVAPNLAEATMGEKAMAGKQELVIGPLAWSEAKKVSGLVDFRGDIRLH